MYSIRLEKSVLKFLEKHKGQFVAKEFVLAVTYMKLWSVQSLDIKRMKGSLNKYRLRIGKYRFKFIKKDKELVIHFIGAGKRGDIYKAD